MKTLFPSSVLALALLAGCASSMPPEPTDVYVADNVITSNVKSSLAMQPGLNPADIYVETYQGKVQLSGFTSTQQEIDTALAAARSIAGVKSVTNDLRVK